MHIRRGEEQDLCLTGHPAQYDGAGTPGKMLCVKVSRSIWFRENLRALNNLNRGSCLGVGLRHKADGESDLMGAALLAGRCFFQDSRVMGCVKLQRWWGPKRRCIAWQGQITPVDIRSATRFFFKNSRHDWRDTIQYSCYALWLFSLLEPLTVIASPFGKQEMNCWICCSSDSFFALTNSVCGMMDLLNGPWYLSKGKVCCLTSCQNRWRYFKNSM